MKKLFFVFMMPLFILPLSIVFANTNEIQVSQIVNNPTTAIDAVPPVVILEGEDNINILLNTNYLDAGATCMDNIDITCNIITSSNVSTTTVGQYIVTYDAVDSLGNQATQKKRIVNVTTGNAPVITISGNDIDVVELNSGAYVDQGATATDLESGIVSVSATSTVNTAVAGTYTITYTSIDAQGNESHAVRTIIVIASTIDTDNDGITDIDESTGGNTDIDGDGILNFEDLDVDGDGVSDKEEMDKDGNGIITAAEKNIDSDNDGIPDYKDYDPQGYFYDETTGKIITGFTITVSKPNSTDIVNLLKDGNDGEYQWTIGGASTHGLYTMHIIDNNPNYDLSTSCNVSNPEPYDLAPGAVPIIFGSNRNATGGELVSSSCGDNQYHLKFIIDPQNDPFVFNNNIPLKNVTLSSSSGIGIIGLIGGGNNTLVHTIQNFTINPSRDTVVLQWQTQTPADAKVLLMDSAGTVIGEMQEDTLKNIYKIELKNLTPNTQYKVTTISTNRFGKIASENNIIFTTAKKEIPIQENKEIIRDTNINANLNPNEQKNVTAVLQNINYNLKKEISTFIRPNRQDNKSMYKALPLKNEETFIKKNIDANNLYEGFNVQDNIYDNQNKYDWADAGDYTYVDNQIEYKVVDTYDNSRCVLVWTLKGVLTWLYCIWPLVVLVLITCFVVWRITVKLNKRRKKYHE